NLPKRRVELYREICQLQLRDRPRARRLETLLTACEAQTILQRVAFEMMVQKLERVERTQLLTLVGDALAEQEEALTAQDFVEPVVEVSELIVQQEDEYEFAHLSFQEYLAAAHVAARPEREELLHEHVREDWWKPTLLLYSGLVNPTKLIREAMVQGANDVAYDCLQETRKRIDEDLKASLQVGRGQAATTELSELDSVTEQVQDARYADLAHYLENGEWKKADDETYQLMITEVGKEVGQWFDPEELRSFPCEPLKTIDGLWLKHSGSWFGFSTQKKMYLECGFVPDGRYDVKTFNKLCEANGWQVNGNWADIKFDSSSPMGHLPTPPGLNRAMASRFHRRVSSPFRRVSSLGVVLGGCVSLLSHPDL
ncbi:MAG: GUN4 domain-containing protein, partial [Cyanobacteria bacterium J06555_13]